MLTIRHEWDADIGFSSFLCQVPVMTLLLPMTLLLLGFDSNGPTMPNRPPTVDARSTNYEARDGEAEAIRELAAGLPPRLYSHGWNTRGPGFRTPGLIYCDRRDAVGAQDRSFFRELPEANWSEATPFPPQFEAAVRFARAYNLTMFEKRASQIARICPRAAVER